MQRYFRVPKPLHILSYDVVHLLSDLLHLKRKGTAERSHTPHVPAGRGHTHEICLSMVPEAAVKVRPEAKAGAEAEALLLKTMPGSQMETGLLVSNQPM